ncbi:MAG: ATP-dependent helicase HrpB [Proteobacteria bacterium]|uniref:ATP-dependent helicase HrpB n=1 Tax=Rudaea sp. TaxID=2136325 RepID=UPI003784BF87|nr:ATP-dependent helicase HrpB [Pseudomonadota bacterium]
MSRSANFPIAEILPELLARLDAGSRLVLEAPPGAGKTTQVPLALLDAGWLDGRKILMLEPRRIAARAAAEFMAAQLGEAVGDTVGYRIRFEAKVSARTRIEVVTEGILTRMIQGDPELAGVGAILFDEFHERHLSGDFGAALALEIQSSLRPDLRLVVMSATLDGERIARWFAAPRLTSAGRSHPVRIEYPAAKQNEDWPFHLRRAVERALTATAGDVLAFLPGRREIERAQQALAATSASDGREITLVPLHGELSLAEQHAALAPARAGTRRIVLATNVAESSVTLPGIRAVIDSGLAREPFYDPNSGFTRLETVVISQASADQRAGRAGRVAEGVAYRLWPQSRRLEPARRAEIAQVELSGLALELAAWGASDLRWLDAPPSGALASARSLLHLLGATSSPHADARPTELGRSILASGTGPRLAAAALRAAPASRALACDLIALVEARNPLRGEGARSDDFRARHAALVAFRKAGGRAARELGADAGLLATIAQAAEAWQRRFGVRDRAPAQTASLTAVGDLLAHAFPDRIARQDANNPRRYALSNGRGASLRADSALYGEPWLVVVDQRFDERDSLVLAAAPFDPDLLERDCADRLRRARTVRWNRDTRSVEAFEEYRFADLVLERRSVPAMPADALPALLTAVREAGLDALPWSDHAHLLRARVGFLREACPELDLPDLSDTALLATLEDWLAPALAGKTRLDSLDARQLGEALAAKLDYAQRSAIDEYAPETLRVPSGNERTLHYEPGKPPVLAVKLQELFGLADTPRIARGRVGVTLHLLSPAQRPIQVTQDLKGFWERTYPEVKKELKGRYPRHPWPDDPWTAAPTARAKPRAR